MSEHIRSLIVIVVLAAIFFAIARKSSSAFISDEDFTRRRNIWFAMTIAAFLSQNFWLYIAILIPLLLYAKRYEPKALSLYFITIFVLPMAVVQIPGMGVVNYIFELSHARILSLFILLPAFLVLRRQSDITPFGRIWPDKLFAAFLLLSVVLYSRGNNYAEATLTNTMRAAFYMFIDVFLPYYVISRSLKNLKDFRDALFSFLLAIMIIALFAVFESLKGWLLYSSVVRELQLAKAYTGYMGRGDLIRAIVSTGHPIALGYLMIVGMGLFFLLQYYIPQKNIRWLGMTLLIAGLIASLSRGPWVGAVALIVIFIATGRYAARRFMMLTLVVMLVFSFGSMLPGGEKLINLLPFIGSTDKQNIDYREDLLTNSMIVIKRNPWFGSTDYLSTPEMEAMRQGENIIDIVNSYIGVALDQGFTGLSLYVSFFALTMLGIYRAMRSIQDRDGEEYLLGRALLATLVGILVTIFTVSSITIIPLVYWSVAGLGVAYAQMVRNKTN